MCKTCRSDALALKAAHSAAQRVPSGPTAEAHAYAETVMDGLREGLGYGRVGQLFAEGETPLTTLGYPCTPFPRVDVSSERKAANTLRRVDAWLLENAKAEISRRNLLDTLPNVPAHLSQADRDLAEMILFEPLDETTHHGRR